VAILRQSSGRPAAPNFRWNSCTYAPLAADGVAIPEKGSQVFQLRENVTLTTNHAEYSWLNPIQIWAPGTVDLSKGEIRVKGYSA
jgi:hypothetical protein